MADAPVELEEPGAEKAPAPVRQPKYTKIGQQELPAFRPLYEPLWVCITMFSIAVVLFIFGGVCLGYGLKPTEYVVRYDDSCLANIGSNADRAAYQQANAATADTHLTCDITFTLAEDLAAPVFVWYQIEGIFQNHRRYLKSRNDLAMAGESYTEADAALCAPMRYMGNNANTSAPIFPCGLFAWSNFNDSYAVATRDAAGVRTPLDVSDKGIALASDVKNRYTAKYATNFNQFGQTEPFKGGDALTRSVGGQTVNQTLQEDERFIIWMRGATSSKFRKLWGRIDAAAPLRKGAEVVVTVTNRYNTYDFDGTKSFVLGTTTWLGSRNPFLGVVCIVTAGLSLLLCLAYLAVTQLRHRKFGDVAALSFYQAPGSQ